MLSLMHWTISGSWTTLMSTMTVKGVESIEDIAEHLFDAKYRNEVIQWLKEKAEFYSSNEELNAPDDTGKTMTEQCKYILNGIDAIFSEEA